MESGEEDGKHQSSWVLVFMVRWSGVLFGRDFTEMRASHVALWQSVSIRKANQCKGPGVGVCVCILGCSRTRKESL